MESQLKALRLQKAQLEIEVSRYKLIAYQLELLPHMRYPVRIYRDGGHWVCILETDPEPMNCVIAYGESPAQACRNFDSLWNGANIIEPEEEEF